MQTASGTSNLRNVIETNGTFALHANSDTHKNSLERIAQMESIVHQKNNETAETEANSGNRALIIMLHVVCLCPH